MEKKLTAVDWLTDQIVDYHIMETNESELVFPKPSILEILCRKCKEMEKQQFINAFEAGHDLGWREGFNSHINCKDPLIEFEHPTDMATNMFLETYYQSDENTKLSFAGHKSALYLYSIKLKDLLLKVKDGIISWDVFNELEHNLIKELKLIEMEQISQAFDSGMDDYSNTNRYSNGSIYFFHNYILINNADGN